MSAGFRCDRTLLDAPWLLEIYCLCQANPLVRIGTAERTRLFCVAIEQGLAQLQPWMREYLAAYMDGLTQQEIARRIGCSPRTLTRRLLRQAGAA